MREGLAEEAYFLRGPQGTHAEWGTRLFDYGCRETLRLLLANLCHWARAFRIDGVRFDAVSTALYRHRSLGGAGAFNRGLADYYEPGKCQVDDDALAYFSLANLICHDLIRPPLLSLAEEHSGLPGLCAHISRAGLGFDFRMAMGAPR